VKQFLISLMIFASFLCHAQEDGGSSPSRFSEYMAPGMEVAGIRAPYYDDEGKLQAQLYGGFAKVMDGGVAEITNLRIDVYRDEEVAMVIFAPVCTSKIIEDPDLPGKKVLSVTSDGDVLIELEEMSISGRGFRFTTGNNRLEILHESNVLVKAPFRAKKRAEL